MSDLQHHIGLGAHHLKGNGGLGRVVLLPGSRGRAQAIAEHFDGVSHVANARALDSWAGTLTRDGHTIDVLSISSGMGTASTEIVMHELLAAGARRVVRVGSCGALDPNLKPGQVAILTGAVRDETATRHIAPVEFPAVSHPDAVAAMVSGARAADLADHAFLGVGHTKASLYAREFGQGPLGDQNKRYGHLLRACGAIASDMEAAMLFIQASARSAGGATPLSAGPAAVPVQAACVLGVYGDDESDMDLDPAVCRLADERAITIALAGAVAWVHPN
jgi:uridine phosphorylase